MKTWQPIETMPFEAMVFPIDKLDGLAVVSDGISRALVEVEDHDPEYDRAEPGPDLFMGRYSLIDFTTIGNINGSGSPITFRPTMWVPLPKLP